MLEYKVTKNHIITLLLECHTLVVISLSLSIKCIKAEMLKWAGKEACVWISDMFNDALQHGMPYDWTTNWIKPLHKGGDVNNVNNYELSWLAR